ncbi:MAG: hypothetical protein AB9834_09980 [Lentimicrobium sp.]
MENQIERRIQNLSDKKLVNEYMNRALLGAEKREFIEIEVEKRGGIDKLNPTTTNGLKSSSSKTFIVLFSILTIILLATLPFHYVFYKNEYKFFPKDNFTFKDTFITEDDINKLIERHNNADFSEHLSISNESIYKRLVEEGIIVNIENKEIE